MLELDIKNQNLKELPKLGNKLINLDCSENELTTLEGLPDSLVLLLCQHNQLRDLSWLSKNLKVIFINYNPIESLDGLWNFEGSLDTIYFNQDYLKDEIKTYCKVKNCQAYYKGSYL